MSEVLPKVRSFAFSNQLGEVTRLFEEKPVEEAIAANPAAIEEFKAGKERALGFIVGQVMKKSQGKANPGMVNEILKKKLGI